MLLLRELVAAPFRIRDMDYERGLTHARHAHSDVQVSVIIRGSFREDASGVSYRGFAGDVVVKPAGIMHADEFEGTRIVCVDFARDAVDVALGSYAWHRVDDAAAAGFRVARGFLTGADIRDDVDELVAALPARLMRDRIAATRAAEALEESYTLPLRIGEIASSVDLHPVYLTRIFREQWGCSPREYRQRLRTRAAVHLITSTARELSEIACETGFSDQAHMTRVIAKATGLTPASLRRTVRH